ncbi:uncharacterized protein LOC132305492 [Cornus florida]|uniref:uncharacterized protein LOC132305492 n=1 Tax=Cornus florida TaxID=4283 RepID=UPI00289EE895|nr:uncharacterized protein LOC132305492 [Cornus florida]
MGRPIILKKWEKGMEFNKETSSTIPLWVKFFNIPYKYWTAKGLNYITSAVGKPLFADEQTESMARISYARVCIEVNAAKPIVEDFQIRIEDGKLITIDTKYQWIPHLCDVCKCFRHSTSNCKSNVAARDPNPLPTSVTLPVSAPGGATSEWKMVQKNKKVAPSTNVELHDPGTSKETCSEIMQPFNDCVNPPPSLLAANQFSSLNSDIEPPPTGCTLPMVPESEPCCYNQDQKTSFHGDNVTSSTKEAKSSHTSGDTAMTSVNQDNKVVTDDEKCKEVEMEKKKKKKKKKDYRRGLWKDICRLAAAAPQTPWLLLGDFNVIRHPSECFGGSQRWTLAIDEFNKCIHTCELCDLRYCGTFFTWTNKSPGVANISKKLNRVLANDKWLTTFLISECEFLPHGVSDHSPMVVKVGNPNPRRNSLFRFFNFLGNHRDFLSTVTNAWDVRVDGNSMFQVTRKLKSLKQHLKLLNTKEFSEISLRVIAAKDDLNLCQKSLDSRPSDEQLRTKERASSGLQ